MTPKKTPPEAALHTTQTQKKRGKTVRRSLVEAKEAQDAAILARELRTSQTQQELAVLVAVEFTGETRKRQLTASARLARTAAAVVAGEEDLSEPAESNLDFDAARAEFEELMRSWVWSPAPTRRWCCSIMTLPRRSCGTLKLACPAT